MDRQELENMSMDIQDRVDELEVLLSDEKNNVAGLYHSMSVLNNDNKHLQQENDDLRAALLEAPNAQMVAFIAAWELWMNDDIKSIDECEDAYPGSYGGGMLTQARGARGKFYNLKAQYLKTEVATDG